MIVLFRYCRNFSTNSSVLRRHIALIHDIGIFGELVPFAKYLQVVNVFVLPALLEVSIDGANTLHFSMILQSLAAMHSGRAFSEVSTNVKE